MKGLLSEIKTHKIQTLGILVGFCLFLWSIWQLDLIVSGPVWQYGWSMPPNVRYADMPFQSWIWKTTVGQAYDTLFFLLFFSLIIVFVSLWSWNEHGT